MNEDNILFEEEIEQNELPSEQTPPEAPVPEETISEAVAEDNLPAETPEVADTTEVEQPEVTEVTEVEQTEGPETPVAEQLEPESTAIPPAQTPPSVEDLMKKPAYHERYYLRYNEGKRTMGLDLNGAKVFLQDIGFDGGELKQAREGKDRAENFRNADKNKKNQMYCSYCGTEIAGVEFYRLPDGRLRCTSCSESIVKTKAEVEELCQRVITNMDNFFGATIDVPVSIRVLDERKLKKKVGVPLGTRDDQSMLILGVAINKKKEYSILLENGAPRISLIATFAHELTHIWQYTHWDSQKHFKKCPKNKRLLIYEGMAKWAEIQYLYLIGETNVARREEALTRNREDEYGIGFCLYEDRYPLSREAMTCENTPFTAGQYPLD